MGRIMSFDQDGRMARDFDKSDYDFLCRYGRTPEDVLDENAKLRQENKELRELCEEQLDNLMPEICAKAWWCEGKDWHTCNDDACGNYTFVILARELGVTA